MFQSVKSVADPGFLRGGGGYSKGGDINLLFVPQLSRELQERHLDQKEEEDVSLTTVWIPQCK